MKRIILIVLILAIFFVLGLIILKKYDKYEIEQFQAETSSASIEGTSQAVVTTSTCDKNSPTNACISDIFTDFTDFTFITKQGDLNPKVKHIYIYDENDELKPTSDCTEYDCQCDMGECCDKGEETSFHCMKKTTIKYYDTNDSKYTGPDSGQKYLYVNNTLDKVHNSNLVFFFILPSIDHQTTAASIPVKKYIVTTQTNLWSLYTDGPNLFVDTNNSSESDGERESYQITDQLKPLKEYQVDLKITKSDIEINITDGKNNHSFDIKFNKQICSQSSDCPNDKIDKYFNCIGKIRNKKCDFEAISNKVDTPSDKIIDIYYFGINIHSEESQPSNIFIGEKIKFGETPDLLCDFYGEDYSVEGSESLLKSGGQTVCLKDCYTNSSCSYNECYEKCKNVTVCDFQAVGRHEIDCIQHCVKNDNCEAIDCKAKCEDDTNAPWKKKLPEFDSQYFDPEGKPSSVIVVLINVSTDGTKATISWRPPYPGKLPVKGYISYLYKTFKKSEAVKINKINNLNCIDKCEFVIKELTPGETYTISIKAYNDIGLGKMSNLLTFKSSVMSLNLDMRIEDEIDEHSVGDFKYCDVN